MSRRVWLLLPTLLLVATVRTQATELVVHIDRIDSSQGTIRIAVHRQKTTWLEGDTANAFRLDRTAAHIPSVRIGFSDIPPGRYAIKVFQDVNGNGVLDRNLLGMPSEPWGVSNNVRARFSLPPFGESLIKVKAPRTEIRIHLR